MKGILADINITGQVRDLVETFFTSEEWAEIWRSLGVPYLVFANLGLDPRAPDDVVIVLLEQPDGDRVLVVDDLLGRQDHGERHAFRLEARGSLRLREVGGVRVTQVHDGIHHFAVLAALTEAGEEGLPIRAQVPCRPVGVLLGLEGTASPFVGNAVYTEIAGLGFAERVARLRDPVLELLVGGYRVHVEKIE